MISALTITFGCQTTQSQPSSVERSPIVAMLNSRPIYQDQIWPSMAELAGKQAFDEMILTQLLDQHALRSGWIVTENDLQSELDALIITLNQLATTDSTPRLIESIRRRRGLGPTRFRGLLRRNTILRRMIAESPEIQLLTDQEIQAAMDRSTVPMTDDRRQHIRQRAVLVAEQTLMERTARELVNGAEVLIMDRSIIWSGE